MQNAAGSPGPVPVPEEADRPDGGQVIQFPGAPPQSEEISKAADPPATPPRRSRIRPGQLLTTALTCVVCTVLVLALAVALGYARKPGTARAAGTGAAPGPVSTAQPTSPASAGTASHPAGRTVPGAAQPGAVAPVAPGPAPSGSALPQPVPTGSASAGPAPSASAPASPAPTASASSSPAPSASASPSPAPSRSGSPSPAPSASASPSPAPSASATAPPPPPPIQPAGVVISPADGGPSLGRNVVATGSVGPQQFACEAVGWKVVNAKGWTAYFIKTIVNPAANGTFTTPILQMGADAETTSSWYPFLIGGTTAGCAGLQSLWAGTPSGQYQGSWPYPNTSIIYSAQDPIHRAS